MIKKISLMIGLWGICFLFSKKSLAAGFNLKSISQVDTSGQQISQWWYSGSQPIFRGEAGPGNSVSVSIDEKVETITADESGNWSYSSLALVDGDHKVSLSSEGSNIDFTLTTGVNNVNWDAVGSSSGSTSLPTAGVMWPSFALLLIGVGSMTVGGKMIRARQN